MIPCRWKNWAAVAHFSPYHFHRIFRGMVGESVKEHVRRLLRLERSAQRLRDSNDAILEIALDAGYESHESFTRAFRAMFGESPSEFRDNRRELRAADGFAAGFLWRPSGEPRRDALGLCPSCGAVSPGGHCLAETVRMGGT